MTEPQLGAWFTARTPGLYGTLIRWGTNSSVNHAGIYLGNGEVIEALSAGAAVSPVANYDGELHWSTYPLTDEQRTRVVEEARKLIGVPYSWVDVACVALAHLIGVHVSEPVRKRLRRQDRLMCSQLVDTAYLNAGIHLFGDGRLPGDVSPGDLYLLGGAQ